MDFYQGKVLAEKYKVQGHPTLVLTMPGDEQVWTRPGVASRAEIVDAFNNVLR